MNDLTIEPGTISNTKLWDDHFKTNPAATKRVNKGGGRTITTIDAYHQIKEATEAWGPMGKWGMKNVSITIRDEMAILEGYFYYPDGEFFIVNSIDTYIRPRTGSARRDTDWGKKLQTDTMTKALSYLGFNADVFFGLFDNSRYVDEMKTEFSQAPNVKPRGNTFGTSKYSDDELALRACGNELELLASWKSIYARIKGDAGALQYLSGIKDECKVGLT